MFKKGLITSTSLLALSIILGGQVTCAAESAASGPGGDDKSLVIEDILVTAQRRSERLQDTPIAVTALSGATLAALNVSTLDEVTRYTPNLRFDSTAAVSGARFNATVFIRGIGQNDYAVWTDPGVGIYVDGVYFARSVGGIMDALDLAQVEILRGPQGTLFGKNTVGGAVLVTTERPTNKWGGSIQATAGSFNERDLKAFVNAPLVDNKLMARLSVASINRDGYARRIPSGDKMGDRDTNMGRLQVRWLPSEVMTIDLNADYTRAREQSAPMSVLAMAPAPGLTGIPFLTTYNAVVAPHLPYTAPNGLKTLNSSYITHDPDVSYATGPNTANLDFWGVGGTVSWNPGSVEVKNILAYRRQQSKFGRDGDGSPYTYRENRFDTWQWQFSEELQVSGKSDRLKWIAGLYFFKENGRDNGFLDVGTGSPIVVSTTNDVLEKNKSYAAYGQVTYDITRTVGITLGARINKDEKYMHVRSVNLANSVIDVAKEGKWTSTTPTARIQYQPTPDALLYFSYSRGFKSGGFNARPIFAADVTQFNPEKVGSFEAGAKTSWFDHRLTANLAGYLVNYTDIQESVIQTPRTFIANAAKARIKGFEAEFVAKPVKYVDLNLAAGYTDAKYTSLSAAQAAGQILPITLSSRFVKAPKWTLSGGVQLTQPLGTIGRLLWRVDGSYFSSYYNDVPNTPQLKQASYLVSNASVTFEAESNAWKLSLFVKNIGDKRYLVSGNSSSPVGLIEATYSEPRMWGATVTLNF